jgi:hypothetical protein
VNSILRLAVLLISAIPAVAATVRPDAPTNAAARPVSVVSFAIPAGLRAATALEFKRGGRRWPVQADAEGRAIAVVAGSLEATVAKGTLVAAKTADTEKGARAIQANGRIELRLGDRLVAAYRTEGVLPRPGIAEGFRRDGYLHPLLTPGGRQVTDDYPSNHQHHHGVWTAWTKTTFQGRAPDFWNMGDRKGRVELVAVDTIWSGPVHAGFRARHRLVDLTTTPPATALEETWEVRLFDLGPELNRKLHLLELTFTQRCATDAPLELPEYHYGGLGVRGNWAWNGAGASRWLTSAGIADPIKGNATRARWCWLGGPLDGGVAGVGILGAADNFRAPEPVRLHPSEPFFCFAPSQGGPWAIRPGQPHVARYRFVLTDGEPDTQLLDGLWDDFARPLAVTFGK